MNEETIADLTASVRAQGILEPLLVTPVADSKPATYRLVAGFRRLAAARSARLAKVPVRVLELGAKEVREIQLVENLQREDLAPLDEARAFKELLDGGLTQQEIGKRIGRSQPYVANRVRLLGLPDVAVQLLDKGKLTPSAAESILSLPAAAKGARESLARKAADLSKTIRGPVGDDDLEYSLRRTEDGLRRRAEIEEAMANAKFPTCPAKDGDAICGRKPTSIPWDAARSHAPKQKGVSVDKLQCSKGHEWKTATGTIVEHRNYSGYEAPSRKETKPTLPEVEPIINGAPPTAVIARRLVDGIEAVSSVSVEWDGTLVQITLNARVKKELRVLPSFATAAGTSKASVLQISSIQSWSQRDDAGRRQCAKDKLALEDWLSRMRSRGRPKKKGKR